MLACVVDLVAAAVLLSFGLSRMPNLCKSHFECSLAELAGRSDRALAPRTVSVLRINGLALLAPHMRNRYEGNRDIVLGIN